MDWWRDLLVGLTRFSDTATEGPGGVYRIFGTRD